MKWMITWQCMMTVTVICTKRDGIINIACIMLSSPTTELPSLGLTFHSSTFSNAISSTSIMDLAQIDSDYYPLPHISTEQHLPRAFASASRSVSSDKRKQSSASPEFDLDISDTLHTKKSRRVCANAVGRPSRHVLKGRSSRTHSRQQTLAPSPEPIYRSSRSRSTSCFPSASDFPIQRRRWCVDDDGTPGPRHLSSEMVVKKLMKTYKGCVLHLLTQWSFIIDGLRRFQKP